MQSKTRFLTGVVTLVSALLLFSYGPSEAETDLWMFLGSLAGLLAIVSAFVKPQSILLKIAGTSGFLLLLLAQVPAIYMWFTSPLIGERSKFVVSEWYSIPHFLVVILAIASIVTLFNSKRS